MFERAAVLSSFAVLLMGCPSKTEVTIGVDATLEAVGLATYLQAAYEDTHKERLALVYLDTDVLQAKLLAGEVDSALVVSEATRAALEKEGIPVRSEVFAHEELVFIGPQKNYLGDHIDAADGVGIMQAMARSNYRYLKGRAGSAERARHDLLFAKSKDRMEPGAFMKTKHEGTALVRAAVEANAFSLVKRSSLLLTALDGVRPHRVYREADPQLVLRLALVEVHPAKTKRPRHPGFYDFVTSEAGRGILARFGEKRFGIPVYGPGDVPVGQGAQVPKLASQAPQRAPQ